MTVIKNFAPELYPVAPTSITPVRDLSNWMGGSLQGYTDLSNNIQINANLYGDCKTPVDPFLTSEFLQTVAHEWLHVQQSTFEKALTHGPLHSQIDSNAEIIAANVLKEFQRRRKATPQDSCTCPSR
ncbi:hypothetical protein [Ramlibacter agri]|nr:hypothetical protein [Ramlibacter agri]